MIQHCTTCKHAKWKKHRSGRRDFSRGECTVEIQLPFCFMTFHRLSKKPQTIQRITLSKAIPKGCPWWAKI